jgi:DnaK suppressor protein
VAQIREELLRLAQRLERSRKITRRAARPVKLDQTAVGRLSRMDALQNQHLTKGLQAREEARHAQVMEAL